MARPSKRTIYERIESKQDEIRIKEKELFELNKELQELFEEQKQEEMLRLYEKMIAANLTIEDALNKIEQNMQNEEQYNDKNGEQNDIQEKIKTHKKIKNKTEETEQISLEIEDKIE